MLDRKTLISLEPFRNLLAPPSGLVREAAEEFHKSMRTDEEAYALAVLGQTQAAQSKNAEALATVERATSLSGKSKGSRKGSS